jgi:hypothetical protein
MADWARLLSECWGLNLSRGFESRPPRLTKSASLLDALFVLNLYTEDVYILF